MHFIIVQYRVINLNIRQVKIMAVGLAVEQDLWFFAHNAVCTIGPNHPVAGKIGNMITILQLHANLWGGLY